jgi:hypothetical protein
MVTGQAVVGPTPEQVVQAFNASWNDHDLDAAIAMLTDDCVFDATGPAPDGRRSDGPDEIRAAWQDIFADPASRFEVEELITLGDRVVQRWLYSWGEGHIRGIDVFKVDGDLISEKLSYVKG